MSGAVFQPFQPFRSLEIMQSWGGLTGPEGKNLFAAHELEEVLIQAGRRQNFAGQLLECSNVCIATVKRLYVDDGRNKAEIEIVRQLKGSIPASRAIVHSVGTSGFGDVSTYNPWPKLLLGRTYIFVLESVGAGEHQLLYGSHSVKLVEGNAVYNRRSIPWGAVDLVEAILGGD